LSLAAEFEASGLSRKAFCTGRGLSVGALDLYRKRARESPSGPRLVAVDIRPTATIQQSRAAAELTVVLANGRRVEVQADTDMVVLERVVAALERA
jgi:hypothetical protein